MLDIFPWGHCLPCRFLSHLVVPVVEVYGCLRVSESLLGQKVGYANETWQVDGSFVQIDTHPFLEVEYAYSDPLMLDWDKDGDLDLLVLYKKAIYWFEQLSDGTSVEHILKVTPINYYTAGDLDGDGDIDLLTVSQGSKEARFFERTEDGELEEASDERNPFKAGAHTATWGVCWCPK